MNASINRRHARAAGFSLIEVLIAVVVLSVGLLALANLQINLVRSSSETKSQSVALSIGKDSVEQLRSYRTLAGYLAINSVAQANAATTTVGGIQYSVWRDVTRYAFNTTSSPPGFSVQANTAALGSAFTPSNEFKTVRVTVGWTDATGAARTVTVEDAIGALPPENSSRVARARIDSSNRRPRVVIRDPSLDDGVIPIAIGDGSETAATNPRPTVAGNQGTAIRETTYDIFTYAALTDNSGNAIAQSRVETAIIGCNCDTTRAVSGAAALRPTYWDGTKYLPPRTATYTAPAGEADLGNGNNAILQSDLCTTCCRDHHDPSGVTGAKFSPLRNSHTHFLNGVGDPVTSGPYTEACRMIRVDGFFRVAADPYNEYYNLLATANNFQNAPPAADAVEDYQDFVIDYLDTQFTDGSANTYNTSLTQEQADTLAADLFVAQVSAEVGNERWLHSRGLYIDKLESEAINAIDNARVTCPDNLTESECVLRALPFTSINLTEVSNWKPFNASVTGVDSNGNSVVVNDFNIIAVSKADFVQAINSSLPVRGKVTAKGSGTTLATGEARKSNTGLLGDEAFLINPDETTPEAASQEIRVAGPACGNTYSGSVARGGGVITSSSAQSCPASPGSLATTRIRLTLGNFTSASNDVAVVLIAPDNTRFTVASGDPATFGSVYVFTPAVVGSIGAGNWQVEVTNNRNGSQADSLGFRWSVGYLLGGVYTVNFDPYTFATTTTSYPGIAANPTATCNPALGGNPYTCSTFSIDTATTLTVGNYNYTRAQSYTVPCSRASGQARTTTCTVTGLACRNFGVAGATRTGSATETGTIGTISGTDGKLSETTPISFTSIASGDAIQIQMVEGTSTLQTVCQHSGTSPAGNTANCTSAQMLGNPCN